MPKIYSYFGIIFLFHTNEHYPIHVHAQYGKYESVFELIIKNGKVVDIIKRRNNTNPLPPSQSKQAIEFVWARKEQIVQKWFEALVQKKKMKLETITKKVGR